MRFTLVISAITSINDSRSKKKRQTKMSVLRSIDSEDGSSLLSLMSPLGNYLCTSQTIYAMNQTPQPGQPQPSMYHLPHVMDSFPLRSNHHSQSTKMLQKYRFLSGRLPVRDDYQRLGSLYDIGALFQMEIIDCDSRDDRDNKLIGLRNAFCL